MGAPEWFRHSPDYHTSNSYSLPSSSIHAHCDTFCSKQLSVAVSPRLACVERQRTATRSRRRTAKPIARLRCKPAALTRISVMSHLDQATQIRNNGLRIQPFVVLRGGSRCQRARVPLGNHSRNLRLSDALLPTTTMFNPMGRRPVVVRTGCIPISPRFLPPRTHQSPLPPVLVSRYHPILQMASRVPRRRNRTPLVLATVR